MTYIPTTQNSGQSVAGVNKFTLNDIVPNGPYYYYVGTSPGVNHQIQEDLQIKSLYFHIIMLYQCQQVIFLIYLEFPIVTNL